MRLVQIDGARVVNVSVAAEGQDVPDGWVQSDVAQIGWDVVDGVPAPPPPEVKPISVADLSFPQLLYGLVSEGWITAEEADAWLVQRQLPQRLDAVIAALPPTDQILAKARALQPTKIAFEDQMVQAIGAAEGKTEAEMAAFFTKYYQV